MGSGLQQAITMDKNTISPREQQTGLILEPEPAQTWHFFLKPDLGPKWNLPSDSRYAQLRGNGGVAKWTWLNMHKKSFFTEDLISSIPSTEPTTNLSVAVKKFCMQARNVLTS